MTEHEVKKYLPSSPISSSVVCSSHLRPLLIIVNINSQEQCQQKHWQKQHGIQKGFSPRKTLGNFYSGSIERRKGRYSGTLKLSNDYRLGINSEMNIFMINFSGWLSVNYLATIDVFILWSTIFAGIFPDIFFLFKEA